MKDIICATIRFVLVLSTLLGDTIIAEDRDLTCEVKFAKPKETNSCLRWKTNGGDPANAEGKGAVQTLKIILPDGKTLTVKAQNVVMFADEDGIVENVNFHLAGDDLSFAECLEKLIATFRDFGVYEKVNAATIDKMRSQPRETYYPKAVLENNIILTGAVKKSVLTLIKPEQQTPDSKLWRVEFSLTYFKDGVPGKKPL